MANLTNDLMPCEIPARDLTPGDLVDAGELIAAVASQATPSGRLTVERVEHTARPGHVVVKTREAGGWIIPADLPLTVNAAICDDCGESPHDCDCPETDQPAHDPNDCPICRED